MNEEMDLILKPCPCCGGRAELYVDFKEMPDTTQLHKIKCVDTFGCGLEVCDMLSGYSPNYKKEIQALADRWNRRPKITEEEVREQCRSRNQMIISGEENGSLKFYFRIACRRCQTSPNKAYGEIKIYLLDNGELSISTDDRKKVAAEWNRRATG